MNASPAPRVAVEFDQIVEAFGPVRVLHGVSFRLDAGRVYGLPGENGAGKSTLMKILCGYEQPTGGVLRINGEPHQFANSRDAEALGIVLSHQDLMVARELADLYPSRDARITDPTPALRVRDFIVPGWAVPGWAEGVSFKVRPGEILGFAGLVGARRTELFEGLLGRRSATGTVEMLSGTVPGGMGWRSPRDAARHGLLSGGNLQKLALAKVLQPRPEAVVLDEPSPGVDIGAKRDVYFLIQRLAREGLAVIVISSELMELMGLMELMELMELISLCHRVAVMRADRVQTTLDADDLTEEEVLAHATGPAAHAA